MPSSTTIFREVRTFYGTCAELPIFTSGLKSDNYQHDRQSQFTIADKAANFSN